jgi:hypothetical protein
MCFGSPPKPPDPPPLPPAPKPPPPPAPPPPAPAPVQQPDAQPMLKTRESRKEEAGTLSQGTASLRIPLNVGSRGGLNQG